MNVFSLHRLVGVVKIHPPRMQDASMQTYMSSIIYFTFQFSIPHGPMGIFGSFFLFFSFPFSCAEPWANFTMKMTDVSFSGTHAGIGRSHHQSSSSGSYYRHPSLHDKYRKHVSLNCVKQLYIETCKEGEMLYLCIKVYHMTSGFGRLLSSTS